MATRKKTEAQDTLPPVEIVPQPEQQPEQKQDDKPGEFGRRLLACQTQKEARRLLGIGI